MIFKVEDPVFEELSQENIELPGKWYNWIKKYHNLI